MKYLLLAIISFQLISPLSRATAAEKPGQNERPIQALLVTGGCCHDYDRQKLIIPRGVSARADVRWTVVHQGGSSTDAKIPLYEDPNWAEGFDIVVHNECFAKVQDVDWVERVLKPHREGLPGVVIHCAMHCYRTGTDQWFEFCGVQSPGHGPHYAYTVENEAADDPIMRGFGKSWTVPKGELYHIKKLFPHCKPLASAKRRSDGEPQVCIWTNQYHKARVFGATIGHYNETMAEPIYLDMLTRGMLWATDRLDEQNFRKTDAETDAEIKALASLAPAAQPPAETPGDQDGEAEPVHVEHPVQAPAGFSVSLFGQPPTVNYPVCLTAAPTGEVFVGVDEQGSLGKEKGGGKILRCIDTDGDGVADAVNEFAKVDHPRGLIYDQGKLWVLHPPTLSVYYDDDLDGVADRHETLIDGISTEMVAKRGADHTTNGIRMGIDGWIYIAVGDFGFTRAEAKDGTLLSRRGGGIVRIRPDGGEMEIYCWGLRNILDVSIDPYLNIFTRDNTNDGGGWNVRLSHIMQTARYGYPSLYLNFSDEIMPPLVDAGGGSGCGAMYLHDPRWPEPFGDALYTCDWGRNEIYRHNLPAHGATFDPHQETFITIPRPTDLDVDGSGRMYVSSWNNGSYTNSGTNVGFVAQVTPEGFVPKPFPNLPQATDAELIKYLAAPSAVYRQHSQREILRRGPDAERSEQLLALAGNEQAPLYGRVAAIFTLKQLDGAEATPALVELLGDAAIREFALRALTDRKSQLNSVPVEPIVAALQDADPRVRAQAAISLGRLGDASAAAALLPLTTRRSDQPRPTTEPLHAQPDPGGVLPHLAVQSLVALGATEACLAALDGPHRDGALWALRYMHSPQVVDGLIARLNRATDSTRRHELLTALIRLYHREGEFQEGWWGTRPDTSGPYFDRTTWEASEQIATTLRSELDGGDEKTKQHLEQQLARHHVNLDGGPSTTPVRAVEETQTPLVIPQADANNPNQIANLPPEQAAERAMNASGDASKGKLLFTQQSCIACHTDAEGQTPKGPHLVDIGKRYKRSELVESVLQPSAKIAQGFDTYTFITVRGRIYSGFVVGESAETVVIRQADGVAREIITDEIDERVKQEQSMMPTGLVNNLTPEQLADLVAYLESI